MAETTTTTPAGEISGNVLFYSRPEPLSVQLHGKLGGIPRVDGKLLDFESGLQLVEPLANDVVIDHVPGCHLDVA